MTLRGDIATRDKAAARLSLPILESRMTEEIWYRYELRYRDKEKERPELLLFKLPVKRRTASGVWLESGQVVKPGRRRYAYPTEAEARRDWIAAQTEQWQALALKQRRIEAALALLTPKESVFNRPPPWFDQTAFDTRLQELQKPWTEEDAWKSET